MFFVQAICWLRLIGQNVCPRWGHRRRSMPLFQPYKFCARFLPLGQNVCPVAYRSRRQITFSGTVKNPFGRDAHEDRLLLLLRRAVLQEQDGRVPGGLAHARVRRRGPRGRLRRRHIPRQGPRRPHRAVAEVWPQTMVQRCLWHAFSQVNRHTTSRPRLRAGMLRGLDGVGAWFEGGRIWFGGAEK